jgi:2-C-methyl-D-erythritol 4-phosphate cytidylyltransferase
LDVERWVFLLFSMLTAIIVAAGSSTRAGFDKLLAKINGRPVIEHAVTAFENAECVNEIIVVCRNTESMRDLIGSAQFKKVRAVVRGGERRQDSVQAGLKELTENSDFVAVHDAARPLIMPGEIERVFSAAQKHSAAALAAPVSDTLKSSDSNYFVSGSIDRKNVFAMQTPQIFRRQVLVDAYRRVAENSLTITDEVSAIELAGGKIAIVPAEDHNLKITFASDLPVAEFILKQRHRSSRA